MQINFDKENSSLYCCYRDNRCIYLFHQIVYFSVTLVTSSDINLLTLLIGNIMCSQFTQFLHSVSMQPITGSPLIRAMPHCGHMTLTLCLVGSHISLLMKLFLIQDWVMCIYRAQQHICYRLYHLQTLYKVSFMKTQFFHQASL